MSSVTDAEVKSPPLVDLPLTHNHSYRDLPRRRTALTSRVADFLHYAGFHSPLSFRLLPTPPITMRCEPFGGIKLSIRANGLVLTIPLQPHASQAFIMGLQVPQSATGKSVHDFERQLRKVLQAYNDLHFASNAVVRRASSKTGESKDLVCRGDEFDVEPVRVLALSITSDSTAHQREPAPVSMENEMTTPVSVSVPVDSAAANGAVFQVTSPLAVRLDEVLKERTNRQTTLSLALDTVQSLERMRAELQPLLVELRLEPAELQLVSIEQNLSCVRQSLQELEATEGESLRKVEDFIASLRGETL